MGTDDAKYVPLDIRCRYQSSEATGLSCGLAERSFGKATNEVDESICRACSIGRVYRELGCKHVGGRANVVAINDPQRYRSIPAMRSVELHCRYLKRKVDWDTCYKCPNTHRPVVQEALAEARGLLERLGFKETESGLKEALLALQAGFHADAARKGRSALESCLCTVLQRLGVDFNTKADIGELWQTVKKHPGLWSFPSGEATQQIGSGIISIALGVSTIRSQQTDAHGRAETPETILSQAELAFYSVASLCLFIARRCVEATKASRSVMETDGAN